MVSKPRIPQARTRITMAPSRAIALAPRVAATPRLRGRAGLQRRLRWLRQHPLCVACRACGLVTVATIVDHVVPLWQGGADDETNLQSLCTPHHDEKTAREASERART